MIVKSIIVTDILGNAHELKNVEVLAMNDILRIKGLGENEGKNFELNRNHLVSIMYEIEKEEVSEPGKI